MVSFINNLTTNAIFSNGFNNSDHIFLTLVVIYNEIIIIRTMVFKLHYNCSLKVAVVSWKSCWKQWKSNLYSVDDVVFLEQKELYLMKKYLPKVRLQLLLITWSSYKARVYVKIVLQKISLLPKPLSSK